MGKRMIISTSGYYSTGSSAVFALLQEYSSCTEGRLHDWQIKGIDYEQALLYTPDGLFDLEDKLLIGNSIHRSDEAIRKFRLEMMRLYKNNYIWIGGFKKLLGSQFMDNVDGFIESIVQYTVEGHWEFHYGNNRFNLRKLLGSIKHKLLGEKIIGDFAKMPSYIMDERLYYSFVRQDEFYKNAKKFIYSYFDLVSEGKGENLILNHFLLPHNFYRIPFYFDDDFRVIVVDRDPRDVYVMEKYRIREDHSLLPCDSVENFVSFWKNLRESERKIDDNRIIRVQFEDLIYKYDETVLRIEQLCGLSSQEHVNAKKIFSPTKSKYNTQLFKRDHKWDEEIEYIQNELSEYLYPFPDDKMLMDDLPRNLFGIVY